MNNSFLLKVLLTVQAVGLLVYTLIAFQTEGFDLFSVFVRNILSLTWSGQFNLDFSCYLLLSGLWIMWRDRFSVQAIFIGVAAMIVGIMLFAPYVLQLLMKENGDVKRLLAGNR